MCDAWSYKVAGGGSAIVEDLVAFFEDVGDGVAALEAPGGPLDTAAGDGEHFADLRALAEAIARAVERGDAPTLRRILEAIQARTSPPSHSALLLGGQADFRWCWFPKASRSGRVRCRKGGSRSAARAPCHQ